MATWTKLGANASATNVCAFSPNVTAGSLLVVGQDHDQSNGTGLPSDTIGTIYSLIRATVTGGLQRISWWWGIAPSSAANTVTCVGTSFSGTSVLEVSVDAGTIAMDGENTAAINTSTVGVDAFSTASVIALQNGSLAVSYWGSDNGGMGDLVAGTGCVLDGQAAISGSANDRQAIEHKLAVSAGALTLPWTTTAGTARGQVHVGVFSAVVSVTTNPIPIRHARETSW